MRKWIAASGSDLRFKAVPFLVTTYRGLYARLRPKETITIAFRGHRLHLDLTDVVVARSLVTSGEWEQYETRIFSETVEEGMVVVDIGANIGHYTLEAARRVGKAGKVFAFEPEPHNFSLLCRNIEANGYQNVVPVQMALSNRTGAARLTLSPDNLGGHHFENSRENGKAVTVGVTTLDEYMREERQGIDVIKMDAEGAEMGILEGMKGILIANPDLILFTEFFPEAMRAAGHEPEGFLKTLMESGFRVGILDQSSARIEALPEGPLSGFIRALLEHERGKSCVDLLCVRGKRMQRQLGREDWPRNTGLAQAAGAR
jgi:FkbM family methyltransferase